VKCTQKNHVQYECGKYLGIFHGIVLVPQNIVMDLNNVTTLSWAWEAKGYQALERSLDLIMW
jgi:hypothetical protein